MSTEAYISLRLAGDSFDEHAIPLSFLRRLTSLEGAVIELAKDRFLADYPNRTVPRSLTKGWPQPSGCA